VLRSRAKRSRATTPTPRLEGRFEIRGVVMSGKLRYLWRRRRPRPPGGGRAEGAERAFTNRSINEKEWCTRPGALFPKTSFSSGTEERGCVDQCHTLGQKGTLTFRLREGATARGGVDLVYGKKTAFNGMRKIGARTMDGRRCVFQALPPTSSGVPRPREALLAGSAYKGALMNFGY